MATNFYQANPNLKAIGVNLQYTKEQIEEYIKCKEDPIYFIKNYIKIISLDKGLINFELFDYQINFIKAVHENSRVIGMFPRQMGKCLSLNTKVKLKQKSTGKVVEVTLGEFYAWQKFVKDGTPETLQELQHTIQSKLSNGTEV